MLSRRSLFALLPGVLPDQGSPAAPACQRRVSQAELNDAIESHAEWLAGGSAGRRAVFANCDLSALDLSPRGESLTDFRAADFTQANLRETTAARVSFVRASLHGADLSGTCFADPAFSYASLRNAICVNAVWGTSREDIRLADFQHADVVSAVLTGARIRGLFCDTRFTSAHLEDADFSHSRFLGAGSVLPTSFFGANLRRASFDKTVLQAARFSRADLADATFRGADVYAEVHRSIQKAIAEQASA
jgi:uncharacterized protein YjbI with pentapeptide repeats